MGRDWHKILGHTGRLKMQTAQQFTVTQLHGHTGRLKIQPDGQATPVVLHGHTGRLKRHVGRTP